MSVPASVRPALAGAVALAIIVVLTAFAPGSWRLWGLDGLACLPPVARWSWLALSVFVALAAAGMVTRSATMRSQAAWMPAAACSVLVLAMVILLPAATLLRGDGQFLVNVFTDPQHRLELPPHAVLSDRLLAAITRAISGAEPAAAFRLVALAAAVITTGAWLRFARRFPTAGGRLLVMGCGLFSGALPIMAGLVEFYALAQAFVTLALVLAVESLAGERIGRVRLGIALLSALLAVGCHLSAAVALLGFPAALLYGRGRRYVWGASGLLTLVALAAFAVGGRSHLLWPLGPRTADGYGLFDPRHLLDLVNLGFWAAPVTIAVVWPLAWRGAKRSPVDADQGSKRVAALLGGGAAGGALFAFVFAPELGMARDADLLSILAAPVTLAALWRVRSHAALAQPGASAWLAAAALLAGLSTVGAQIAVQARETSSVDRFVRQLERDPGRSAYGWEVLSMHHRARGNAAGEEAAIGRAHEAGGNPRFLVHLARFAWDRGDLVGSERLARRAIAERPDQGEAHALLGLLLFEEGREAEALPVLEQASRCGTRNADAHVALVSLILRTGRAGDARAALARAQQQTPAARAALFVAAGMIEQTAGNAQQATRYFTEALRHGAAAGPWRETAENGLKASAAAGRGAGNHGADAVPDRP